jgi:hypothetical protein
MRAGTAMTIFGAAVTSLALLASCSAPSSSPVDAEQQCTDCGADVESDEADSATTPEVPSGAEDATTDTTGPVTREDAYVACGEGLSCNWYSPSASPPPYQDCKRPRYHTCPNLSCVEGS